MERRAAIEEAVAHLPLMLTVEQAREVLGIGRSLAYSEVRRYLATGGREGIPAIRIGSAIRVPRAGAGRPHVGRRGTGGFRAGVARRHPSFVSAHLDQPDTSQPYLPLVAYERCGAAAVRRPGLIWSSSRYVSPRNVRCVLQTGARGRVGVMLRVTTLYASSAIATALYYTRYLAGTPGEEPGVWCGDQAIGLGLSGRVDADDLQLLLEGRDPSSGTPLGNLLVDRTLADGKVVRAVAGFDATFSAPKSVRCGGR